MIPKADHYRKYHDALLWLKAPKFLPALAHDFGVFFAESDWDDPVAAWEDFKDKKGIRSPA